MTQLLRYLVKSLFHSVAATTIKPCCFQSRPDRGSVRRAWFCDLSWLQVKVLRHTRSRRVVIKLITRLTNSLFFIVRFVTLMQSCVRVTLLLRVELGLVLTGHEVN